MNPDQSTTELPRYFAYLCPDCGEQFTSQDGPFVCDCTGPTIYREDTIRPTAMVPVESSR